DWNPVPAIGAAPRNHRNGETQRRQEWMDSEPPWSVIRAVSAGPARTADAFQAPIWPAHRHRFEQGDDSLGGGQWERTAGSSGNQAPEASSSRTGRSCFTARNQDDGLSGGRRK